MQVVAIFGPTAVGKTGAAIALAELLRERGEDPVAVSCDAIQVYSGLEILSGAAKPEERSRLEHRLLGLVPIDGEFSAGRYAQLAHSETDQLLAEGRRPIVVGGTGLYLRAALAELDLRPPVPGEIRREVEAEIAERGPEALHAELDPDLASGVHPNDRKRVARLTELQRAGIAPPQGSEGLWTSELRHPTALAGLTIDREELKRRIDERVDRMLEAGALEEVRRADEAMKRAQRAYARRQLTWMRKMPGVELIDRSGRSDEDIAPEIASLLREDPQ
jgi:tRNA dimethylallyltransferase